MILAVVASIAGHPVTVACDADVNRPSSVPAGAIGWAIIGGDTIHIHPLMCDYSRAEVGSPEFAAALDLFIHESAHARGVLSESCAEMTADVGVFDVLRRFYGIPFFTPMSRRIGAQVLAITRTLSPEYQPELCWNTNLYG